MTTLEKLEEEAMTLIKSGNQKDYIFGDGMMKVISEVKSNYTEDWKSVSWDVLDFESRARELWNLHLEDYPHALNWQDVYDKDKFEDALSMMIMKHDATLGISWDTVDFWLDELCLKDN